MQAYYPADFEREVGSTESEWLRCLPGAVGEHPLKQGRQSACVELQGGRLELQWHVLPPRQIALIRMPRLYVHFRFESVGTEERHHFMRHFDLHMLRGGG